MPGGERTCLALIEHHDALLKATPVAVASEHPDHSSLQSIDEHHVVTCSVSEESAIRRSSRDMRLIPAKMAIVNGRDVNAEYDSSALQSTFYDMRGAERAGNSQAGLSLEEGAF